MKTARFIRHILITLLSSVMIGPLSAQAERLLISAGGSDVFPELIQLPGGALLTYRDIQTSLLPMLQSANDLLVRDLDNDLTYVYPASYQKWISDYPQDLIYLATRPSLTFERSTDVMLFDGSYTAFLATPGNLIYISTEAPQTGEGAILSEYTDVDQDRVADILDCQPRDSAIFPGADEIVADGIDQDCNGVDTIQCYLDGDGDTAPNESFQVLLADDGHCDWQQGEMAWTPDHPYPDCDDTDSEVYPGATENGCNGIDNDCNGEIDDGVFVDWFADTDADTYGDIGNVSPQACSVNQLTGYVADSSDCDDLDAMAHPGQSWYLDADNDGYPEGSNELSCMRPIDKKAGDELESLQQDNCPTLANPNQTDVDADGIGAACDTEIFFANDDTPDGVAALSGVVANGIERIVAGSLTGEHLSGIAGLHISAGSVTYHFTPGLIMFNILAADFGGATTIRAYNTDGDLLISLAVTGTSAQSYTLDEPKIASITISSTAGWFGPMSYIAENIDDDLLLMIIPTIISATQK